MAQDEQALRLMGANPVRIKQWAFGIATAVLGLAGALLIIVGPVEPTLDRAYIGRTFCVVVLAGLGSMTRHARRRLILGIAESIVLTMFGASWAPASPSRCCSPCSASARKACSADDEARNSIGSGPARPSSSPPPAMRSRPQRVFFFAGYVILQFVVLATAWNILGGYAGYVNFGTGAFFGLGVYTAVVLFKAFGAPLVVQIVAAAASARARLRRRHADAAPARHLLRHRHHRARVIMETLVMNWRYVGGATGLQLLRPAVMAPFDSYIKMLFVVLALLAVHRGRDRALHPGSLDRPRPARAARRRGGGRMHAACRRSG